MEVIRRLKNEAPYSGLREDASTADRILEAADVRFAAYGSTATRLSDITADLGLTTGALYRNYQSKDDLQSNLVARLVHSLADVLANTTGRREAIERTLYVLDKYPGALRLMFEQRHMLSIWGIEPVVSTTQALQPHLAIQLSTSQERLVATFLTRLLLHYVHAAHDGGLSEFNISASAYVIDELLNTGIYPDETISPSVKAPDTENVHYSSFVQWRPSETKAIPRSEKAFKTRQNIQLAASRVFRSRGMANTMMADIATEAGVASGTTYRYFTDKADVLRSMQAEVEAMFIQESHLPLNNGRIAIREQVLAYLNCYRGNLGPVRAWRDLADSRTDLTFAWNGMRDNFVRRIEHALTYGGKAGLIRTDLDLTITSQVHAIGYEAAADGLYIGEDNSVTPSQLADIMYAMFVGGMSTLAH